MKLKKKAGNVLKWIKEHVQPDFGLNESERGEELDWKNDSINEISGKLRRKIRAGLKITFKF